MNNNICFLILKSIGKVKENAWKLGKIFLNKYQFSFNQDSKMIIFYNKIKSENKNETENAKVQKNNNKFNMNYLWIIIICLICLIAGIFIGNKIITRNRKKRLNELQEEEYDYKADEIINNGN